MKPVIERAFDAVEEVTRSPTDLTATVHRAVTLVGESVLASGLLTEGNSRALNALEPELVQAWERRQIFRTKTEMAVSVLNDGKFPTPSAKYWQCVREQTVMLDQLMVANFEYRRNEVALARLRKRLSVENLDPLDVEEIQIDIDQCLYKKAALQQDANDRMREIQEWSALKQAALKIDPSIDIEDVNAHQLLSLYKALLHRQASLTPGSSQAEVSNVLGPLATAERILRQAGMLPTDAKDD
jgi:hypothetical protein